MRRIAKSMFGFGLAFVGAMVLLELFLRLSGAGTPSFVISDPRLGVAFRPGANFVFFTEGMYLGGVNKYGYLGPAYPPKKESGVLRVALLGDSFIEGFQLFDRFHLRTVLENELNRMGPRHAEVMNFGYSGFDLGLMYYHFTEVVEKFSPDVALFFVGQDDMAENGEGFGPIFSAVNDSVRVDLSFAQSARYKRSMKLRLVHRLALYSMARNVYLRVQEGGAPGILLGKVYDWFHAGPRKETPEPVGGKDNFWPLNKAIFDALAVENRSGKIRIAVVEKRPISAAYREYIRSVGIPVYDLQPVFDALKQRGIRYNYWPGSGSIGHWNFNAHEAIGEYLAPLVNELAPPPGKPGDAKQ